MIFHQTVKAKPMKDKNPNGLDFEEFCEALLKIAIKGKKNYI